MPSTGKYSRTPTNPVHGNFRHCVTKNIGNCEFCSLEQSFWKTETFRKTGGFLCDIFWTCQTNFVCRKLVIAQYHVSFWRKLSERPKRPLHDFFLANKKHCTCFSQTPVTGSPRNPHRTSRQCQKLSEAPETSKRSKLTPLMFLRYCETKVSDIFWWYAPMLYRNLCAGQMSNVDTSVFSVCSSSRSEFSEKQNSHFSSAVFHFQNFRVTHTSSCRLIDLV